MNAQRIAIVGAGVAGLSAARSLMEAGFDVVVYEKDSEVGGHATTIRASGHPDEPLVDPGVQVICPATFPHILALTRQLGVQFIPYSVGFTLRSPEKGICGTNHDREAWWREVEPDLVRFSIEVSELMRLRSAEVISCSLGDYFASNGYSDAFVDLMASLAAIIGPQEDGGAMETSLVVFASVLSSGFLSLLSPSSHEVAFKGGVKSLIDALAAPVLPRVRLDCGVSTIRRLDDRVEVVDAHGRTERFDQIIVCVDGLLALKLLEDPSPIEENILSDCQVKTYASVLHTDDSVLIPDIHELRRTYLEFNDGVMSGNLSVLNLEKRSLSSPLFLSYESIPLDGRPPECPLRVDSSKILNRVEYRQTKDNTYSFVVKRNIHRIQGKRRTWYAGAWTTMSTLEHSVVSGLVIAEKLGARYPFADNPHTAEIYQVYRRMMLEGAEDFPLSAL
jgi:predicted NAD/FAD-binding protein